MTKRTGKLSRTIVTAAAAVAIAAWAGCQGPDELTKVEEPPPQESGRNGSDILPNGAGDGTSDTTVQPNGGGSTIDGTGASGGDGSSTGTGDPTPSTITAVICVDATGTEVAGAVCGADNLCRDAAGNIIEGTCQEVVVPECPPSTSLSLSTSESTEDGPMDQVDIAAALADGMSISTSVSTSTSVSCSLSTSTSTSSSTSTEDAEDGVDDGL